MSDSSGRPVRSRPTDRGLRFVLILFTIALAARGGWGTIRLLRAADPNALEFPDENDYWSLAESVAYGDGLVGEHGFVALRMPLYPVVLSLFADHDNGVIYAKILHWLVGAAAVPFVGLLARRLAGDRVGWLAGLAVAFDPFLVFFSSLLLTETFFITAIAALWYVGSTIRSAQMGCSWGRWIAVGCLSSLCIYLRESSLVICASWIVLLIAQQRFHSRGLVGGLIVMAIVVGSLIPWAARNDGLTGHWCWLTHRGGISLFDGVRPEATGASDLADVQQMPAVKRLDEASWHRYFLRKSLKAMKSDPWRIARLAGVKFARTWNPFPNVDTYQSTAVRLVSSVWTIGVYGFALMGIVRLWEVSRASIVALLLPALCIAMLHSIFVGSVRYRLPAMPFLEILSAVGVTFLFIRQTVRPAPECSSPRSP